MVTVPKDQVVADALAELDKVRREWMRRPGVSAVDVGFKIKDGQLTDQVALRVHVARKLPVSSLEASEVFNASGKAPKKQGGFPVDVIEATYGPSQESVALEDEGAAEAVDRRGRVSPLMGGISCGNARVTAGTLGAIVFDRDTCQAGILSNWHVLAGSSAARAGEQIWQPGRVDGGQASDTVATLTRFRLDAQMDAAFALLNGTRTHDREILGLGVLAGSVAPRLGMLVVKSGRTTAITRGIVSGLGMSVSINYGDPGVVVLNGQVNIVPRPPWPAVDYEVSQGGDSGSVWMEEGTRLAVGLHFAGETTPAPASEHAIATPAATVAAGLNISFLPVVCRIKPTWPIRDFCDRYPWICERIKLPPIPRPPIVRPPIPGPGPGPFLGAQSGGCGCGCGGGGGADREEELLAAIAELLAR